VTAPGMKRCPWCSAEIGAALSQCPACNAVLVDSTGGRAVPGVNAVDSEVVSNEEMARRHLQEAQQGNRHALGPVVGAMGGGVLGAVLGNVVESALGSRSSGGATNLGVPASYAPPGVSAAPPTGLANLSELDARLAPTPPVLGIPAVYTPVASEPTTAPPAREDVSTPAPETPPLAAPGAGLDMPAVYTPAADHAETAASEASVEGLPEPEASAELEAAAEAWAEDASPPSQGPAPDEMPSEPEPVAGPEPEPEPAPAPAPWEDPDLEAFLAAHASASPDDAAK
jgi:hypothetical protein